MNAPANIPSMGHIARASEPGQWIQVSGTIFGFDGATPAPDIVLFLYHTDAQGYYNHPNSPFNPRIHGWIKSDSKGRYRFVTVKPGPYPELDTPAHIHVHLFGPRLPEYWVDEYMFEGDPLITPASMAHLTGRGGFNNVIKLTRSNDGLLYGVRDFKLQHVAVSGNCHLV